VSGENAGEFVGTVADYLMTLQVQASSSSNDVSYDELFKFRSIKFDIFRSSSYLRVTTAARYVVSPSRLLQQNIMSEQCYMEF